MKHYLVKFYADYADEFNVEGAIVTTKSPDEFFQKAEGAEFPYERYFGTNEAIYFQSFEDYQNAFEFVECTKEFHDEFKKLFGSKFGHFLIID